MSTLDKILTFVAVIVATLAAVDPFGFPTWVQAVAAAVTAGFAAIGIYTPSPVGTAPRSGIRQRGL